MKHILAIAALTLFAAGLVVSHQGEVEEGSLVEILKVAPKKTERNSSADNPIEQQYDFDSLSLDTQPLPPLDPSQKIAVLPAKDFFAVSAQTPFRPLPQLEQDLTADSVASRHASFLSTEALKAAPNHQSDDSSPVPNDVDEEVAEEDYDSEIDEEDWDADEDDYTEPDDSTNGDSEDSANAAGQFLNEAEQIDTILQQISNRRVTGAANEIRWSLDDAITAALVHSNRITSLQVESTEALQNVGVEYGQFDVAAFVEQSFRDSSEPVGSSIDTATGTQEIVQEEDLNIAYGLRQQLRSGGDFELSQSYQIRDNDSGILVPDDQAFSRLNGRLTKELLRGAGRSIAMNQVLVAYHDAFAQQSESVAGIADHLNEVMTAYWDIFAARGALFASIENRQLAIKVRTELNSRSDIDAEPNLIAQSEATIRQRELQINQAHSDLIKAQIQFISLVNAPELLDNSSNIEILPQVTPNLNFAELDIASRVNTAIQRRPEIGDIIQQFKSAQVTDHLSLNELLPQLSLSLEGSLNGLEGDRQLGEAISNQFENDLTYQVGFDFEVPLANRRARFNKRRTELAVARLGADWQVLIEQVKADVLDNAQEFSATQRRLQTQREVLKFTASELRYLALRKTVAPKETDNVSFALTQVLSAQDRQGEAKTDFVAAIADKHRAIFELNRATGILINSDVIPNDGGVGCPTCFSVYHQFIEDRNSLDGPLDCVETETRAKSNCTKRSGVGRLNLDSYSCHASDAQEASGPDYNLRQEVIQAGVELPATTAPIRYPLQ